MTPQGGDDVGQGKALGNEMGEGGGLRTVPSQVSLTFQIRYSEGRLPGRLIGRWPARW